MKNNQKVQASNGTLELRRDDKDIRVMPVKSLNTLQAVACGYQVTY